MNHSLDIEYLASLAADVSIPPSTLVDLLAELESAAYSSTINPSTTETLSNFYSVYIFSLFLCDDLNEARFLTKRIPTSYLQSDPLLISTYTLLRALYTRTYPAIYTTLSSAPWSSTVAPLATRFLEHFRRKTFILLSRAYTTISPKAAANYLGLVDGEEATMVTRAVAEGWEFDETAGMLRPVLVDDDADLEDLDVVVDGKDGRIARLTGLVTHLTEI